MSAALDSRCSAVALLFAGEAAMSSILRWLLRALMPLWMFLACVLASGGCQCSFGEPIPEPPGLVACRTQRAHSPAPARHMAAAMCHGLAKDWKFLLVTHKDSACEKDCLTPLPPSPQGKGERW